MQYISKIINFIKKKDLYPKIEIIDNNVQDDPYFYIKGNKVLSFNSCNYLGLSNFDSIKNKVSEGINRYGIHPSNSPLVSGTWDLHLKYSKELAKFIGYNAGLLFSSTTMANMGVIPAIANMPLASIIPFHKLIFGNDSTTLFSDELNHATLIDGCRLSKVDKEIYKHLDFNDLEKKLSQCKTKRKIIITDGIFSMDGHITPLPELIHLSKAYGANIVVDDAHAMGILGKNGSGSIDHYNIREGIDILITSLSKGFGLYGSIVCSSEEIVDYLKISSRTYIFTRSFLAPMALGGLEAIEVIKGAEGQNRRQHLWSLTSYFKKELDELGFNTLNTQAPIIPILIGDEKKAKQISYELYQAGIYIPPIQWPAVPKGEARIRFLLTALFKKEDIDFVLEVLKPIARKYKVI